MSKERKLQITPICPFVVSFFEKNPEFSHLLYKLDLAK